MILIVVVRYGMPLEESPTMRTLGARLAEVDAPEQKFRTLVWDNTPIGQTVPAFPFPVEYRHSDVNVGVSGAYNYAMEAAARHGCSWLLLLDQDSTLPAGFLRAIFEHARRLEAEKTIAAVAPTVLMCGVPVSPKIMSRWGGAKDPVPAFQGPVYEELIIMNSGMLLRVSALRQIGGYSMDFWLDFSDRYVCHMLAEQGYGAWVAGELRFDHHVSSMAGAEATSMARYETLMGAQDAYFSQYKSLLRNIVFCQRLLRNALRERKVRPERARILWRHLLRRFTVPKRRRLEEWRRSAAEQRRAISGSVRS